MDNRDFNNAVNCKRKIHNPIYEQCLEIKKFPKSFKIPRKITHMSRLTPNQIHKLKVEKAKQNIDLEYNRFE